MQYATLYVQLTHYIYSAVPNSCCLWSPARSKTSVQNARTRLIVDCRSSWKDPARLQIVWQAPKLRCCNVPSFSVTAEYIRVCKCLRRWKCKRMKSGERGGCAASVCRCTLLITTLFVLWSGIHSWIYPRKGKGESESERERERARERETEWGGHWKAAHSLL